MQISNGYTSRSGSADTIGAAATFSGSGLGGGGDGGGASCSSGAFLSSMAKITFGDAFSSTWLICSKFSRKWWMFTKRNAFNQGRENAKSRNSTVCIENVIKPQT